MHIKHLVFFPTSKKKLLHLTIITRPIKYTVKTQQRYIICNRTALWWMLRHKGRIQMSQYNLGFPSKDTKKLMNE